MTKVRGTLKDSSTSEFFYVLQNAEFCRYNSSIIFSTSS